MEQTYSIITSKLNQARRFIRPDRPGSAAVFAGGSVGAGFIPNVEEVVRTWNSGNSGGLLPNGGSPPNSSATPEVNKQTPAGSTRPLISQKPCWDQQELSPLDGGMPR